MKTKLFSLAAMLLLCIGTLFAQTPTVAPPTPTLAASEVTTIMGYYGQADGFKLAAYSKAKVADCYLVSVAGSPVWKLPKFDYAKFDFTALDLSGRETLHVDLYTPADGMGGLMKIQLFNGTASNTPQQVMAKGEWKSVDISIKDIFAKNSFDLSTVFELVFGDTDRNEQKTVYIGNVYAYGGTGVGNNGTPVNPDPDPNPDSDTNTNTDPDITTVPSFAVPTLAAEDVTTIFGHYGETAGFKLSAYSQGKNAKQVTIGGQKAWQLPTFDYAKFDFTTLDLSGRETLHIDVYTDADGMAGQLKVGLHNGSSQSSTPQAVISKGKWKSLEFKIKDVFGKNSWNTTKVTQLIFGDTDRSELKTIYIGNIYAYGGTGEGGQGPVIPEDDGTVPALAAPEYDAENVTSIYGYYGNAEGFKISAYSAASVADCTEVMAGEQKVLKLPKFDYAKFDFNALDLSGCNKLHIDLYSANMTGLMKIGLNNAGKTQSNTPQVQLTMGEWKPVEIDMSVLGKDGWDLTTVFQVIFGDTDRSEQRNVYVGNIFAFKGESLNPGGGGGGNTGIGIPLAPTPKHDASDVKAFFSDEYPTLFGKFEPTTYSEGTVEVINHDATHKVCRMTNLNWCAVNLGQRDVSDKGYVHFDFYTPSTDAVTSVNIGFQLWAAPVSFEIEGEDFKYRALEADKWQSVDIPLSAFIGQDFKEGMAGFRIRKTGKGTLYLDNLYFYGKPEEGGEEGGDPNAFPPIQDKTDGELPPMEDPMFGVNLSSASGGTIPGTMGTNYMYPRMEDLYYFKAKGVKLIRFPFRAARVVEDINNPKVDADATKSDILEMKKVVAEAERLGMWVFLDAHDYAERTINGTQHLLGDDEYTAEMFGKMWGVIANEFKGYKNIWGYDLQNEPKVSAQILLECYQAAINEIRKVDTNAQIIVEGTNWASAFEWVYGDRSDKKYPEYSTEVSWAYKANSPWLLAKLEDPQNKIVYQAHGYFDKDNSGTYKSGYQEVDYRKRYLPFLEWCKTNNKRGLIGEFGVPYNEHETGDPRYMEVLDGALQLFRDYQVDATYWCAGAMYEGNSLSCQPDKSALYGNYAKEKSTMKVLEKYFTDWKKESTAIEEIQNDNVVSGNANALFTISGQKVNDNYRGIVIKNGKKLLVK